MKKFSKWIKIIFLILIGAIIGITIFSFIMSKNLWFPDTTIDKYSKAGRYSAAGVEIKAQSYSPWFWNKESMTEITIFDRKNDGPNFKIKLKGLIDSPRLTHSDTIRFIHSGWDLAVIAVRVSSKYVDYYHDTLYLLHRTPRADGEESLEYKYVPGDILAVAPDEKTYFYATPTTIVRRDWEDKDLSRFNIPGEYDERFLNDPIFFSNNNKMALEIYSHETKDSAIIIWNLLDDTVDIISLTNLFPDYLGGKLIAKDTGLGGLYINKEDINIKKIKITE